MKEHKAKVPKVQITRRIIIFAIIGMISSFILGCNRGGKTVDQSTNVAAATVNGKEIKVSEVDSLLNQQMGGQQTRMSQLELAAARIQILDGLIQQEVLFQRAEKEKLLPNEDQITQALNSEKQESRMTEEEYQKRLQETGKTEANLREDIKKTLAVRNLQEKIHGKITISNKEVEDFYNNNKGSFVNARGVGLSAIVASPEDNGFQDDAKSEVEAKAKIDLISQQLKNADFATVARARSEDQSNIRGGDIGFYSEDQLKQMGAPADLVSKFFNEMQIGDITPPININTRWYIFKLTSRQLQNENLTLNSPGVRDKIKDALINQRRALLNSALITVAMNEAKVTNHLAQKMLESPENLSGARPAGASPATEDPNAQASPAATTSPANSAPTAAPATSPAEGGAAATASPAKR
jgi:parvulin-like peptidyl-prolyl isomerase